MSEEKRLRQKNSVLIRNFVFGVEDSLVSTAGLLSGLAASEVNRETIILTGFVLIAVEAFSMAVGSFLSEESAEEYIEGGAVSAMPSIKGGAVMFASYIVAGLIPLSPYLFLTGDKAFAISISLSILALFLLGTVNENAKKRSILRRGLRTALIGGLAIVIGVVVGQLAHFG